MKKTFIILVFLFSTSISSLVCGADFQKGLDAAIKGDYATALEEWMPLAKEGNSNAQFNIGLMYFKGRGVPQDYQETMRWYRLAAEQGFAQAQYNLGVMYVKGQGVPKDYKEAERWYRLAAEQGYKQAQYLLGMLYERFIFLILKYRTSLSQKSETFELFVLAAKLAAGNIALGFILFGYSIVLIRLGALISANMSV